MNVNPVKSGSAAWAKPINVPPELKRSSSSPALLRHDNAHNAIARAMKGGSKQVTGSLTAGPRGAHASVPDGRLALIAEELRTAKLPDDEIAFCLRAARSVLDRRPAHLSGKNTALAIKSAFNAALVAHAGNGKFPPHASWKNVRVAVGKGLQAFAAGNRPAMKPDSRLALIAEKLRSAGIDEEDMKPCLSAVQSTLERLDDTGKFGRSTAIAINEAIARNFGCKLEKMSPLITDAVGAGLRAFAKGDQPAGWEDALQFPLSSAAPAQKATKGDTPGAKYSVPDERIVRIAGQLLKAGVRGEAMHALLSSAKVALEPPWPADASGISTGRHIKAAIILNCGADAWTPKVSAAIGKGLKEFWSGPPAPAKFTGTDTEFRTMEQHVLVGGKALTGSDDTGKIVTTFWDEHDILSNYAKTPFKVDVGGGTHKYTFAEQAFQEAKVRWVFGRLKNDPTGSQAAACRDMINKIRNASDADEARTAAQGAEKLSGFDKRLWGDEKLKAMGKVVRAKVRGHPETAAALRATGTNHLAEASKFDNRWGVGLGADDLRITDSDNWGLSTSKGAARSKDFNQLGNLLMAIREELASP